MKNNQIINKIKIKNNSYERKFQMSNFSNKFYNNANYQIMKLDRAIYKYGDNPLQKIKFRKYITSQKKLGLMQPLALKPFCSLAFKHIKEYTGERNVLSFTIVTGDNFGKDDWNFNYKKLQSKIKKFLKGYDYIANIALDEFPRTTFEDKGTLMSMHVHGIFFSELTRYQKSIISAKFKKQGYCIRPFVTKHYDYCIDALHYSFKALYGGKYSYCNSAGTKHYIKHTQLSLKSLYFNFTKLKDFHIYDLAFAGGKGKQVLNIILEEAKQNGSK